MVPSLSGVWPVIPTPFTEAGQVDLAALPRLVYMAEDARVHGIVLLTYGAEAAHLSEDERLSVLDCLAGIEVPVLVGLHAPQKFWTRIVDRARSKLPNLVGVCAVVGDADANDPMAVSDHIRELGVPWLAQEALGSHLAEPDAYRLAEQSGSSLLGVKIEGNHMAPRVRGLRKLGLSIFTGWGGRDLPECLAAGSAGVLPGLLFASRMAAVYRTFLAGDCESAVRQFREIHDCLVAMTESYPRLVGTEKFQCWRRGLISSYRCRVPGAEKAALRDLEC